MTQIRARSLQSRLLRSHLGMVLALLPALLLLGGWLVWVPILHSATVDLATLIHDDVQTLGQLQPDERAIFAALMAEEHGLYLLPVLPDSSKHPLFLPYLHYLQQALDSRFPSVSTISSIHVPIDGYGFTIQTPQGPVGLGFSHDRIGTAPVLTLAAMVMITLILAMLGAYLQARRLARPIEVLRRGAHDLGRNPKATVAVDSGVQELDDLANTINTMQLQIHQLLEQRSMLLAGVSHDLRTPLTRLGLALELARENPQGARFERMETYLNDMRQLIDSFISFTQINAQETFEECLPSAVIHELVRQRESSVDDITLDITADPPLTMNRLALTRILGNFLDNAHKHGTPPFEIRQRVEGTCLFIEIISGGAMLSEAECSKAFEPFIRLDEARSPNKSGAGLGLAIVRDLALTQGWQVGLLPRVSGGITAWLMIPFMDNPQNMHTCITSSKSS
ncbi:ATP-binding protein [Halothiobacillus sp.]|uniref:ATP-binding protein n=1 Tax=Halothiobacillus sp. TaxID=1891311 RepID=UPI002AD2B8E9|nr:ATP-binding protein [Halothiobacillus sp.]